MRDMEQTEQKLTRAQIMRNKVQLRLAENADGEAIAEIMADNGFVMHGTDWSEISPNWLVAETDGLVIASCMILLAKPVSFVEFLYVRNSVPFKLRAIAVKKLIEQCETTIRLSGAQFIGGIVDAENANWQGVLEKIGFQQGQPVHLIAKRLLH